MYPLYIFLYEFSLENRFQRIKKHFLWIAYMYMYNQFDKNSFRLKTVVNEFQKKIVIVLNRICIVFEWCAHKSTYTQFTKITFKQFYQVWEKKHLLTNSWILVYKHIQLCVNFSFYFIRAKCFYAFRFCNGSS